MFFTGKTHWIVANGTNRACFGRSDMLRTVFSIWTLEQAKILFLSKNLIRRKYIYVSITAELRSF